MRDICRVLHNEDNAEKDGEKYSAQEMLKAVQSVEQLLGRASTDSLLHKLEMQGLHLSSAYKKYSISEVESGLANIFGIETTIMLIERIKRSLERSDTT